MGHFYDRLLLDQKKFRRCLVPDPTDAVAVYASSLGYEIRPKVVLVEGTTDVSLFKLAARFELEKTGKNLLNDLCFMAAGEGERGGTFGVIRELMCFKGLCKAFLLPDGRPRYRVVALFDNDKAGRQSLQEARRLDAALLEFKDLFLLYPVMPLTSNLDTVSLKKTFENKNQEYRGLDWEPEDLLPESFIDCFIEQFPTAVARCSKASGITHRDYTRDGKARFHRFVKENAVHNDLLKVIETIEAMRCYLGLK
jgi:hypothetical protein